MTTGIVSGCYAVAWLFTARLLYGRWRNWEAHSRYCEKHGDAKHRSSKDRYGISRPPCCFDAAGWTDGATALFAMFAALFWPIVLLAGLVRFRPPPTAAEQAQTNAKLTARIADLERELHLGGGA